MKHQVQRIKNVCKEIEDLLIKKNTDYGNSFSLQFEKYGLPSALIRMDDKMRRIENLLEKGNAQVNESIEDSLRDLAGYAILALVEMGKWEEKEKPKWGD